MSKQNKFNQEIYHPNLREIHNFKMNKLKIKHKNKFLLEYQK